MRRGESSKVQESAYREFGIGLCFSFFCSVIHFICAGKKGDGGNMAQTDGIIRRSPEIGRNPIGDVYLRLTTMSTMSLESLVALSRYPRLTMKIWNQSPPNSGARSRT